MSTRVVQDILQHPGGDPIVNRKVSIQLNVPAFITGGTVEVMQRWEVYTDDTGLVTAALTPNAEIDPAGTYYTWKATSGTIWTLIVPAGSGAVNLRDCLVSDPSNPDPLQAGVQSVVAGANVTVNNTDPRNPVISATGGGGGAVASVNGHTGVVVLAASDVGADASGAAAAAQAAAATDATSKVAGEATARATAITSATTAEVTRANAAYDAAGAATAATAAALQKASNLSDVANAATARTNLGLGTAATQASSAFDSAGAATAAQAAAIAASAQRASNLSDLSNAATARTNLGLGTAATQATSAFDAAGAATAAQTAAAADATSKVATETSRATTAEALLAPLASPALTGNPTAPTQTAGNSTTRLATTAFVTGGIATETARATAAEALLAPSRTLDFVKDCGAVADALFVADAAITSGLKVLTSATGIFAPAHVGKPITVATAGTSGADLRTTIASYQSATQVTLTAAAGATKSGVGAMWGTDNAPALAAAITALTSAGGGTVTVGAGKFGVFTNTQNDFGSTNTPSIAFRGSMFSASQFYVSTGTNVDMLYLNNLETLTFDQLTFVGCPAANSDAARVLHLGSIQRAEIRDCTFYGLSTGNLAGDVQNTGIVQSDGTDLHLRNTWFRGCVGSLMNNTGTVCNTSTRGLHAHDSGWVDWGYLEGFYFRKALDGQSAWWVGFQSFKVLTDANGPGTIRFFDCTMDEHADYGISSSHSSSASWSVVVDGLSLNANFNTGTAGIDLEFFTNVDVRNSYAGWRSATPAIPFVRLRSITGSATLVKNVADPAFNASQLMDADSTVALVVDEDNTYTTQNGSGVPKRLITRRGGIQLAKADLGASPVTVSGTTTETTLVSTLIPANVPAVGSRWRVKLRGTLTNTASSSTQFTLRSKIGSQVGIFLVLGSYASANSAQPWEIEFDYFYTAAGGSATAISSGHWAWGVAADLYHQMRGSHSTSSTADLTLAVTCQLSVTTAGNSFTVEVASIEQVA